ncbi:hypothetical protein GQ457_09G007960 [Hibiscus cannabinus]
MGRSGEDAEDMEIEYVRAGNGGTIVLPRHGWVHDRNMQLFSHWPERCLDHARKSNIFLELQDIFSRDPTTRMDSRSNNVFFKCR